MISMTTDSERRFAIRFPIERQVRYSVRGSRTPVEGVGTTVNMSSGGVLFTTGQQLRQGSPMVLEVKWPVLLNESMPLKLVTHGRVVWAEESRAALRIDNWEFRTQGQSAA
jgi:hypothetical protein